MERRSFLKITLPATITGGVAAASGDKPLLSFGVIADPQYVDADPGGSRHYRKSLGKLKAAIKELNQHELKFVTTLGDVIDRKFASFDDIMPIYDELKSPKRFVLGNHDFSVDEAEKKKVPGRLGMKKSYHSETFANWHFIYLDGTDVSTFRYGKESPLTTKAKALRTKLSKDGKRRVPPYGGAIGEKQLAWFSAELKKAGESKKRVIVFNHFPAFPLGDGYNIWNDDEVVALIAKNPHVVAYMNGHRHKGAYGVNKGCHYVNFKGMVETMDKSAYAVVRCYADRLEIDGYETEPDRSCRFGER